MSTTINNNVANVEYAITTGNTLTSRIPANCAVLLKPKKDSYDFVAFACKGTKQEEIINAVLCGLVGEIRNALSFEAEFAYIRDGKEEIETKLKAAKFFVPYLNKSNVIWKTNKDGEINKAIVVDCGTLKQTALYITDKSPLCTATGKRLKALMYTTCKAIVKQATMYKDIVKSAQGVYQIVTEKEEKAKAEKTA